MTQIFQKKDIEIEKSELPDKSKAALLACGVHKISQLTKNTTEMSVYRQIAVGKKTINEIKLYAATRGYAPWGYESADEYIMSLLPWTEKIETIALKKELKILRIEARNLLATAQKEGMNKGIKKAETKLKSIRRRLNEAVAYIDHVLKGEKNEKPS